LQLLGFISTQKYLTLNMAVVSEKDGPNSSASLPHGPH